MRVRAAASVAPLFLLTATLAVGIGLREKWAATSPLPDVAERTPGHAGVIEIAHHDAPDPRASVSGKSNDGSSTAPVISGPFAAAAGEGRLDGVLQSADRDKNTVEVDVHFSTRPDGTTIQLEPSWSMTVSLNGSTVLRNFNPNQSPVKMADLRPGLLISAVGEDLKKRPARQIAVCQAPSLCSDNRAPQYDSQPASAPGDSKPVIWICGDSMAGDPGRALLQMLRETGAARAALDYHVSTGFSVPSAFNWPKHLQANLPRLHPDLTVMIVGANDAQGIQLGGRLISFGGKEWQEEYSRRITGAMKTLTSNGQRVLWVGMPVMRSPIFGGRMGILNKLYWEAAAACPGVIYFDSWALFATPSGNYTEYFPNMGPGRLRAVDGIHLEDAGALRLAKSILSQIKTRWSLSGHHGDQIARSPEPASSAPCLVVEAKLVKAATPPTPQSIAPYRQALVAYQYQVDRVLKGKCDQKTIQVAHWGIRDGQVVPAPGEVGRDYHLTLQRLADHPDLESEKLIQEGDDMDPDMYYQVRIQ